jgi:hypothetical protein
MTRLLRATACVKPAAIGCWLLLWLAACPAPTLWLGAAADAGSAAALESPVDASAAASDSARDAAADGGEAQQAPPTQPDAAAPPATIDMTAQPSPTAGRPGEPERQPSAGMGGLAAPANPPAPVPTKLPAVHGTCPALKGAGTYTFGDPRGRNLAVQIFIAPDAKTKTGPGGPLVLYWHGFGSSASEVMTGFGKAAIDAVVAQGGVVAAFSSQLCVTCGLAEDVAWYPEDDAVSDQVVACAIQQAKIDLRHIHSLGFSAGALHTMHLATVRSGYIASVISYSGGNPNLSTEQVQDPSNPVAALLAYGKAGVDNAVVDFSMLSLQWYDAHRAQGFYSMLCDHGGGHTIPADLVPLAARFFNDHPYKVAPEPYSASIPPSFPAYCSNVPKSP